MANIATVFTISMLICLVSGQPSPPIARPKLSESFSAEYIRSGLGTEQRGRIYRNFEAGKQFQVEQLPGAQNGVVNTLTRADLKSKYKYFDPYTFCSHTSDSNIKINRAWDWIENAEYCGQKEFNNRKVNVWMYNDTQSNVYREIGVSVENANHPLFVFEKSTKSFEVTVFQRFKNNAPSSTRFDVPNINCIEEGLHSTTSSGLEGHTPNQPQPSESSTAHITRIVVDYPGPQLYPINYYMETRNIVKFSYVLYKNYGTGNILYLYNMGTNADYGKRYYLLRDDLSTTFMYYEPFGSCGIPFLDRSMTTLESPGSLGFPARWTWLNETKYGGSVIFHKKAVDLWTYVFHDAGSNATTYHYLGVSKQNPNILNFYFMYTVNGAGFSVSVYDKFKNGDPPDSVFDVPAVCSSDGLGNISKEYSEQIPRRPKLAESFSAEISYVWLTFYNGEETLKPAKLYRNYLTKRQLQVNPLGQTTNSGRYYQLLRLDQKSQKRYTYYDPFGSCHVKDINLPFDDPVPGPGLDHPMWGWVKNATFSGVKQFRQQKVNMWTYTSSDTNTIYSLGVSRRHPNQPVVLFELQTYNRYIRSVTVFLEYNPGPPQENVFKIPEECYKN